MKSAHGNGCYWRACKIEDSRYVRLCWNCFLEWEFLRNLGEMIYNKAGKGETMTVEEIIEQAEISNSFNRKWEGSMKIMEKMKEGKDFYTATFELRKEKENDGVTQT